MSSKKDGAAIVGVGVVACAACCAGPVLGFIAALGVGTVLGVALFGVVGLLVAVIGTGWLIRRRLQQACQPAPTEVALPMPTIGAQPVKPPAVL